MPKVSLIIPVYNVEKYLHQALDSVLAQTMKDFEAICVDDGSTDSSLAILRVYAALDSRFVILPLGQDLSVSQARKAGVLRSRGKYVAFLDSDDYLEPDALEVACRAIEDLRTDVLQFGATVENCGALPEKRIRDWRQALAPYTGKTIQGNLATACFLEKKFNWTLWNKIFRGDLCRDAFRRIEDGYFSNGEDRYALLVLLSSAKSYAGIEDRLYHYCLGRGLTGHGVIDLDRFTHICMSASVYGAMRRFAETTRQEKELASVLEDSGIAIIRVSAQRADELTPILETIRDDFLREQVSAWWDNLPDAQKREGLKILYSVWYDAELVTCQLANACWNRRPEMASYFEGIESFEYAPREVRTIALYCPTLKTGRTQRVVAELCNTFTSAKAAGTPGYRVVLITDDEPTPDDRYVSPAVARAVLPDSRRFPKEDFALRARAWAEAIEKYHIDVVLYSQWNDDVGLWDMLCVKEHTSHPAFVFHMHSFCAMLYRSETRPEKLLGAYALADGVVCLSTCDAKYWKTVNPRTYYIGNPGRGSSRSPRAHFGGKEILWFGWISDEKNPCDVIPIMQGVLREVPDAVCHVVGSSDPQTKARLAAEIRRAGLDGHIVLEGFPPDAVRFYERATVFLMTSQYEVFPLAPMESASHGLPIVAYDMPWLEMNRLLDGIVRVPLRDAAAATSEIVALLADEKLWQSHSDALRRSFRRYEAYDIVAEWEKVFRDLAAGTAPSEPRADEDYGTVLKEVARFHTLGAKSLAARLRSSNAALAKANRELETLRCAKASAVDAQIKELKETYSRRLKLADDARASVEARLQRAYSANAELQAQLKETGDAKAVLESQLDEIRSGLLFRIARAITWLPRKLTGKK